jgi:glutamine amidotransferase
VSDVEIAVIDYGMGNRRSVEKALAHVGARTTVTSDHDQLRAADALVLPGVGAFPAGMASLCALGLDDVIKERVLAGAPLLGICLGMQLLFERSVELEATEGLGLIAGEVSVLASGGLRLPHIGWNEVRFERDCVLTAALAGPGRPFYHVHGFAARPSDPEDVAGTAVYGERFATIVARGALFGVQFHPEKSSLDGLRMLSSFVDYVADRAGSAADLRTRRSA